MISFFSDKLLLKLIGSGHILEEDKELYQYGAYLMLSEAIYLIFTMVIGAFLSIIPESLIFYISFQKIRQISGGYHASSETKCIILSSISIVLSLFVLKLSCVKSLFYIILGLTVICSAEIFLFAPIDTESRTLTDAESSAFRKKAHITLSVLLVIIIISLFMNKRKIWISCCVGIILEGILLLIGKLNNYLNKQKHNAAIF